MIPDLRRQASTSLARRIVQRPRLHDNRLALALLRLRSQRRSAVAAELPPDEPVHLRRTQVELGRAAEEVQRREGDDDVRREARARVAFAAGTVLSRQGNQQA